MLHCSSSENSNMCISDFSVEKFIVGNASGCSKWSVTLKPDSSVNLRMQDTDFCLGIKKMKLSNQISLQS